MRLHVVGLPWTATTPRYLTCAYTQKIVKFCRMMEGRHEVVLYGTEENEAPCAEHVALFSEAERAGYFGEWGQEALFERVTWKVTDEPWRVWNARAAGAVAERAKGDIVMLVGGNCQKPLADALTALVGNDVVVCEPFVGYEGTFTPYCAFESDTWRSHVYGLNEWRLGRWYDATIPNYFDKAEFPLTNEGGGEYLLFVGRVIERKGPHVAAKLAAAAGMPLVVAGPGVTDHGDGYIVGEGVRLEAPGLVYAGEVGVAERAELMAGARALLAPTLYVEPFGGVAVEAMMCGTPAITTDWGAFAETVEEGRTGYHFRTLAEGVAAVELAAELKPRSVRRRARERYSLEAVAPLFDRWLEQLRGLWGSGWEMPAAPPDEPVAGPTADPVAEPTAHSPILAGGDV